MRIRGSDSLGRPLLPGSAKTAAGALRDGGARRPRVALPPSEPAAVSTLADAAQTGQPALLPWRAEGRGYVFAGLRSLSSSQPQPPSRGLAALALVDYARSPVGPYREFAWQPGEVQVRGQRYSHISHICVDSPESVRRGRALFALDKRLAAIDWMPASEGGSDLVTAALPTEAAASLDQARSDGHSDGTATPFHPPAAICCKVRPLGTWRVHLPAAWAQWLLRPLWQPPLASGGGDQATEPTITPLRVSADVGFAWLSEVRSSGALLPPHSAMRLCPLGLSVDNFELVLCAPRPGNKDLCEQKDTEARAP